MHANVWDVFGATQYIDKQFKISKFTIQIMEKIISKQGTCKTDLIE